MFESAEIGHAVSKRDYEAQVPELREALLNAQYELKERGNFPLIILINGVEAAGKGETISLLNEWLDPRFIDTHAFGPPNDEERAHPPEWRYWRVLPPKGRTGILFRNWYAAVLQYKLGEKAKSDDLGHFLARVRAFERMLADEGALILKFWFHLSKDQQRKRIRELEADPHRRWQVRDIERATVREYDRYIRAAEQILSLTSRDYAPWYIIEGADERYRNLSVGRIVLDALRARLDEEPRAAPHAHAAPVRVSVDGKRVLDALDMSKSLSEKRYDREVLRWQSRLAELTRHKSFQKHALVAVFEGSDAAGKGGAIRRVAAALDTRQYRIAPIAAPTEEERAQPYLWRFWRRIPGKGQFTIFDRSWYGRVLVERVEGFCAETDWLRAYGEINDFEWQLSDAGIVVVKFWLAIDAQTQLQRFKEREQTAFKRFKITDEDWRNRARWEDYQTAVSDMVERTSTPHAPWHLIPANDKYYARIQILRILCRALEAVLDKT